MGNDTLFGPNPLIYESKIKKNADFQVQISPRLVGMGTKTKYLGPSTSRDLLISDKIIDRANAHPSHF